MTAGIIVVLIGVLFLLRELGFIAFINWNIIWPIIIILIGLAMISKRCRRCGKMWCLSCKGDSHN